MHIMIDIETLSTRMDATILSIGAVRFTADEIKPYTFHRTISIDSNLAVKRHIDGDTLGWWMKQSEAARAAAFGGVDASHLPAVLHSFAVWLGGAAGPDNEEVYLWGNGANFDISILQSAYEAIGVPVPWNFRNVRCLRTIRALAGASYIARPEVGVMHNALDDAQAQAMWLIDAWQADVGLLEGGQ